MSDFLKDVRAMSPKDLQEFRKSADSDPEMTSILDEQMSQMDEAGRQEMLSILTGEEINSLVVPEGQQVASSRDVASDKGFSERVGDVVRDTTAGIASAVPFSTEIASGVAAGVEVATGMSGSFSESYDENVKFGKKSKAASSEDSPYLYGAGRIAGEIATVGLVGAKAVKGLGVTSNMAKLATNVGVDVVAETGRRFSDSETKTMGSLMESATTASLYGVIGAGAGAAVGKAIGKLGSMYSKRMDTLMKTRGIEKLGKDVNKFVNSNSDVTPSKYSEVLDSVPNIKESIASQDMMSAQVAINAELSMKVRNKARVLRSIENDAGNSYGASATELVRMEDSIVSNIDSFVKGQQDSFGELSSLGKGLDDLNMGIRQVLRGKPKQVLDEAGQVAGQSWEMPSLRVSELDVKIEEMEMLLTSNKSLIESAERAGTNINTKHIMGKMRSLRNSIRDTTPLNANPDDYDKIKFLQEVDRDIRILKHASTSGNSVMADMTQAESGKFSNIIIDSAVKVKDQANMLYLGASLIASPFVGPMALPATALGIFAKNLASAPKVVGGIDKFLNSSDVIEGQLGKIANIGKFYTSGPGARSGYYGSLMSRLATSVENSDPQTEAYVDALDSTQALLRNPLDRTTSDFMSKKEAIMDILKVENPPLMESLQDTLKENGDVGPILEQISKIPAASELIRPGIGWDGITNDPAHKAQLEEEIANQTLISGSDKIKLITGLRNNGIIPDFEKLPQRKPKKYQPRKKGRKY